MADRDLDLAAAPVVDWLIHEAWRIRNPGKLVVEVCHHLIAAGVPVWRYATFIRTLHPEVFGDTYLWRRGADKAEWITAGHDIIQTPTFTQSPIQEIVTRKATVRFKLADPAARERYPVFDELAREGATEWLGMPLEFSDGSVHAVTITTDAEGGFSDAHVALLEYVLPLTARLGETQAVRALAARLLDIYVGHDAGERILSGQIRRGSAETLNAAIWYCDMRDFTRLSDSLVRDDLVEMLNAYFDCVDGPVAAAKGEILKFIGDAVLAVFPIHDRRDEAGACATALEAATAALDALGQLNTKRAEAERLPIDIGIALHVGDVSYGNIGAHDRLDFTVIGPAVNLASRIEGQCRPLDRPLLISADFAAHVADRVTSLGRHALAGLDEGQEIFGLRG